MSYYKSPTRKSPTKTPPKRVGQSVPLTTNTPPRPVSPRSMDKKAMIRFVHNVAGGPRVDIYLGMDGEELRERLDGVSYGDISNYIAFQAGRYEISARIHDTETELLGHFKFLTLQPGRYYTFIIHGDIKNLESIAPLMTLDRMDCPPPGMASIRFVHAAATAPAVDIYAGSTKLFGDVAYGRLGVPTYQNVSAGYADVEVRIANTDTTVLGPGQMKFEDGGIYTLIASGIPGDDSTPLIALVAMDSGGSCVVSY